jgi:selenocysteine lyase/cysteine desulfurase
VDQVVKIYERAITPRTKVIMVSHMPYVTGQIFPVKELADLAHAHNILISVDGAHPLGMLDLNLTALGVDHYAAAGQKWLLAGSGTGMLYVKRSLQERIWPLMGYVDAKAWTAPDSTSKGARKYELGGQRNAPSFIAMGAAIDFQEAIGKGNVEARVRQLGTKLRKGLAEIPGVKLWTSNEPRFAAGLTANRVWIRTMATGNLNAVRASTHVYNMPDEVEKLLDAVSYVAKNSSRFMSTTTAPRAQYDE